MIKVLERLGIKKHNKGNIEQTYSQYQIINEEKLKTIPLKSEARQGYPLSPFNIVLEVLT